MDERMPTARQRSWKASPDPDHEQKAGRILALYERPLRLSTANTNWALNSRPAS